MLSSLKPWLVSVAELLLPRYCVVCGRRLQPTERCLCVSCLAKLPRTRLLGSTGNMVERLLSDDRLCVRRASSFLYYQHASPFCYIYFHFKYYAHPEVAVEMGRMMARELVATGFFDDVDVLLPVPLSRHRMRQRGYNQSERLAQGISEVTGLPIDTSSVVRTVDNPTQTHLGLEARVSNVTNIFSLVAPGQLAGRHVMLVDDTITTGSTLRNLGHVVATAPGTSVSVISLGLSDWHRPLPLPSDIHPGFR